MDEWPRAKSAIKNLFATVNNDSTISPDMIQKIVDNMDKNQDIVTSKIGNGSKIVEIDHHSQFLKYLKNGYSILEKENGNWQEIKYNEDN